MGVLSKVPRLALRCLVLFSREGNLEEGSGLVLAVEDLFSHMNAADIASGLPSDLIFSLSKDRRKTSSM